MQYILVVDDDPEVLGTVWRVLERDGFEVKLAESAAAALEQIRSQAPSLVVLDIVMPEMDGLELCRLIRTTPSYETIPVLFLSARGQTEDVVRGLDVGGDDYIAKPFVLDEFTARVRALLRRAPPDQQHLPQPLRAGDLSLDPNTFQATTSHATVQLTSTEYRLLSHLIANPDRAHSVRDLLTEVWQYPPDTGDPDLVRAHIRNLRAKLEPDPRSPVYIHTIHGIGYMVRADD
jgi:two-component system response regulator RpaA